MLVLTESTPSGKASSRGMTRNTNQTRAIVNGLFRHRRKMLVISFSIVFLTILALALWPRSFESEAKLFVRIGRENVTLDPTASTGEMVTFQKQQEEEINSVLEILNSRETLKRVVDLVGPDEVLSPSSGQSGAASSARSFVAIAKSAVGSLADIVLTSTGLRDPISDHEEAVRKLENRRRATAGRRSGVVTLTCRSTTPEAAQRLTSTMTEVFLEHHVGLTRTQGSHEFFVEQRSLLHDQLVEASDLLRQRKTEYGIVTIEGTQGKLLQEASDVALVALDTDRSKSYGEARVRELQLRIDELPEKVVTAETSGINVIRGGLETQLYALKLEEQDLQSRMTDRHPKLIQIRSQRESMERIIEQQVPDRTSATEAPNPVREALKAELLQEQANVVALRERKTVLQNQLATLEEQAATLNLREVELAELQRNVTSLEAQYNSHVDKLEQARVDKAIQADSISSINVVQPASFEERPVSPVKRLGLVAGLLFAIVCSAGTAFGLETLDPTIRNEEQVEADLGLPLITSIPDGATSRLGGTNAAPDSRTSTHAPPYQVVAGRISELAFRHSAAETTKAVTIAIVNCDSTLPDSIAAELAINAIQMNEAPILLVDADLRHRRAGDRFNANGAIGLSDLLQGNAELDQCLHDSGYRNLSLLTAGSLQGTATALDLRQVTRRLEPLSGKYSLMIADLPAASDGAVDVAAAREFDAVMLVVEAERTRLDAAKKIKRQLSEGGANVLGCVLHGQKEYIPTWLQRFV